MKTTLKIVGILVVMLLIVIGVGLLALPQILSTDLARNKITQVIEQKTGRKLIIAGDTSFKFYPDIGVSLNDISLSNPPRMTGAPLVKMAALRAQFKTDAPVQGTSGSCRYYPDQAAFYAVGR